MSSETVFAIVIQRRIGEASFRMRHVPLGALGYKWGEAVVVLHTGGRRTAHVDRVSGQFGRMV